MLAVLMMSAACSSTSPINGSPNGGDQSSSVDAACTVAVTQYDQSCSQDSDCVGAPPGGDTCGPCHERDPAFLCTLTAINTKDSARYASDLANAFNDQGAPAENCATSCPVGQAPKCVDNVCKLVSSVGDAG